VGGRGDSVSAHSERTPSHRSRANCCAHVPHACVPRLPGYLSHPHSLHTHTRTCRSHHSQRRMTVLPQPQQQPCQAALGAGGEASQQQRTKAWPRPAAVLQHQASEALGRIYKVLQCVRRGRCVVAREQIAISWVQVNPAAVWRRQTGGVALRVFGSPDTEASGCPQIYDLIGSWYRLPNSAR
jgi:hypothetical protein